VLHHNCTYSIKIFHPESRVCCWELATANNTECQIHSDVLAHARKKSGFGHVCWESTRLVSITLQPKHSAVQHQSLQQAKHFAHRFPLCLHLVVSQSSCETVIILELPTVLLLSEPLGRFNVSVSDGFWIQCNVIVSDRLI